MRKKRNVLLTGCILTAMMLGLTGCGNGGTAEIVSEDSNLEREEAVEAGGEDEQGADADLRSAGELSVTEEDAPKEDASNGTEEEDEKEKGEKNGDNTVKEGTHVEISDLKPSEGLEFESNGDGTCALVGIGVCTDTDLVIPEKSPMGDTVVLIDQYAFLSIDTIDSVTLVNYDYEIDKNAFQYGEFRTLNVIGGNPVFGGSSFSSCEDLNSVIFRDCNIQADEYAFFSCGKDAELKFVNCTGYIDKFAFQYSDFLNLTMEHCYMDIDESAFSSCEALTSIVISDSTILADEYAFFGCGDEATLEVTDCDITLAERAVQYASLSTLSITGSKVEIGESAFSSCEDLSTITIDCNTVLLGEYAFYGCEDLTNVSICENGEKDNVVEIDDYAFQYSKRLENCVIGEGSIKIGEYVFSGCADNFTAVIAGMNFTANSLAEGFEQ